MRKIWVYSEKPVGLVDRSTLDKDGNPFYLSIDKKMADKKIPVEVPDNDFFNGKINEKTILLYPDQAKAKKKTKKKSKFDEPEMVEQADEEIAMAE